MKEADKAKNDGVDQNMIHVCTIVSNDHSIVGGGR